jgi:hypothetical protein
LQWNIVSPQKAGIAQDVYRKRRWPVSSRLIESVTNPASTLLAGYGIFPAARTFAGTKCRSFAAFVVAIANIISRTRLMKVIRIRFMTEIVLHPIF